VTDPAAPSRPDVVVIMMDDLAYGDLACHGNPHVVTPHLDRLHGESARLTRYSSGPMCTPARASLMTGRYHQRTRAYDTFCGRSMIDPGEVTLGHVLGAAGYRTGAFGKWHLGDAYPMRAGDLGFEETLVHNAGGIGQPGDHRQNHWREGEAYFDPVLHRDGVPEPSSGYCTDVLTDAAIDFVTRAGSERAPFFCYLATNAPHTPLEVPDEWIDRYRADDRLGEVHARLYAMVENIDWNVGRLLAAIDPATTLVVYTSDHGPCPSARDFSLPPDRQVRWNAGLRGEKGSLYDGAVKVPSFWRGPGVTGGRDIATVASPIDVLPTLASVCGAELPADVALDGVDLSPLLAGGSGSDASGDDRTLFLQWHRGNTQERYTRSTGRWRAPPTSSTTCWPTPAKPPTSPPTTRTASPTSAPPTTPGSTTCRPPGPTTGRRRASSWRPPPGPDRSCCRARTGASTTAWPTWASWPGG